MRKYIIIAESGADISRDMIEKYNIRELPMRVALGNDDYPDGAVSIDEICGYFDKTGEVPKTASVSPYEYQMAYEKIAAENPGAVIIHIGYSAKLTGSFQNSILADEGLIKICHVDSRNVTIGQAFVVMEAIRIIEETPDISPEELTARVEESADLVRFSFVPGNLAFLRAGGRVSNAQYLGASLLRMKPLIELIDGEMISTKKYSGSMKNIVLHMISDFIARFDIDKNKIFMVHAGKLDEEIKADVEKTLIKSGIREFIWHKAGGVITSHSGPGGIGIAGIAKTLSPAVV